MRLKKKLMMMCVLVLTLTLGCFGLVACGDGSGGSGGSHTIFVISEDGSTITGLTEYGHTLTELVIPETWNEKTITSIGPQAFWMCGTITSVTMGDGVTDIGYQAFGYSTSLTSVTLGSRVTNIGNNAFNGCKSLTNIAIPDGVTSIGHGAFEDCTSLTSITIPDSVTSIGDNVFEGCTSLTSVTLGNKVARIGRRMFSDCYKLESIVIPNSVTSIEGYAFEWCKSLTSIVIPDSVTSIGKGALGYCLGLTEVTIPFVGAEAGKTSTDINQYPFGYIFGDSEYGVDGVIETYPEYYDNSYSKTHHSYYIPSSLKRVTVTGGNILDGAFMGCYMLESISLGNGVTSIEYTSFSGTSLKSLVIPDSVTSLGSLGGSSLKSLTIGNGVTTPISRDLLPCTLESLTIGNGVTGIEMQAFDDTPISSITIGNGVTSIGSAAFQNCKLLTSIVIPDSVTSIGRFAFYGCSGLTEITIPFVGAEAGETSTDTYQYPFGYLFGTMSFTGGIEIKQDYETYYIPGDLKKVTVTGGNISDGAFMGCYMLESISLGNGVTSIEDNAFDDCRRLKYNEYGNACYLGNESNPYLWLIKAKNKYIPTCTINNNCKFIYQNAFEECIELKSVTFENTEGWSVLEGSKETDVVVTDPTQNERYLVLTYHKYCWRRK